MRRRHNNCSTKECGVFFSQRAPHVPTCGTWDGCTTGPGQLPSSAGPKPHSIPETGKSFWYHRLCMAQCSALVQGSGQQNPAMLNCLLTLMSGQPNLPTINDLEELRNGCVTPLQHLEDVLVLFLGQCVISFGKMVHGPTTRESTRAQLHLNPCWPC